MSKALEALKRIKNSLFWSEEGLKDINIIEKQLKREDSIEITAIDIEQENKELCKENKKLKQVLEIIKELVDFSLEFDESQNEWFLYISNKEQHILVAKGTGVKIYNLLKEIL